MQSRQRLQRSGLRTVTLGLMLAVLGGLAIGASGCGGSSGGPSGPAPQGLWVPNIDGNYISEFTGSMLKSSGDPAPAATNQSDDLDDPWAVVFDSKRNLWVSNNGNGTLTSFTFAQLKKLNSVDDPAPTVTISGLVLPTGMAFDKAGNLWVSNQGDSDIVEFTRDQLATSGSPTPKITITSEDLESPVSLAFDRKGGLWVTDKSNDFVMLFTSSQLAAGGAQTPTVLLTSNGSGSLDVPLGLSFDRKGNLWVSNTTDPVLKLGTVVEFSSSQLAASGSPTPIITITSTTVGATNSLDAPNGLAFDSHGNLWVANVFSDSDGSLAQFTTKQLATGGALAPNVFIDGENTNLAAPVLITFGPSIKF